jgi:hypothetical protein
MSATPTMSYDLVANTLVVVHGPREADPADWTRYCARSAERDFDGILVICDQDFPGPTSKQRAEGSEAMRTRGSYPRIAVVTASMVHRGVVTVFNWLQRGNLSAFHPGRLEQALAYAGTPREEWPRVVAVIHELATKTAAPWVRTAIHL